MNRIDYGDMTEDEWQSTNDTCERCEGPREPQSFWCNGRGCIKMLCDNCAHNDGGFCRECIEHMELEFADTLDDYLDCLIAHVDMIVEGRA